MLHREVNMKVTFKKESRATGLAGVGHPYPNILIKVDGKVVGYISSPWWQSKDDLWHIHFSVLKTSPEDNPNCDWKWIHIKHATETEPEARQHVLENIEQWATLVTFHQIRE
jgi:hypothetical protein